VEKDWNKLEMKEKSGEKSAHVPQVILRKADSPPFPSFRRTILMKLLPFAMLASMTVFIGTGSAANITALTSFGGGDGWLAPGEGGYAYLGTTNLERSLAYNPVTGNLLLVSRANPTGTDGNNIRILNGLSGADTGALDKGSAGLVTGGTFAVNTVGVSASGAVFVANLVSPATSANPFKVYLWGNEASTPTLASSFTPAAATYRLGDDLDVTGGGTGTLLAAGYNNAGSPAALLLSTANGTTFTGSDITVAGTAAGDFRLGITFTGGTNLYGSQGSVPKSINYSSSSLNGTLVLQDANERPMDYAVVAGIPLLATIQTAGNLVRVYDLSTGTPSLYDSANLTTALAANGNGTGSVAFGAVTGNSVNLYAMNSNNGIQAFVVTIPEPSSLLMICAGAGLMLRRRR
jgi:hypothetical protein